VIAGLTADRPRAVLFDWDNTLVDCWGVIHRALAETFTAMGREPWTLEETRVRVRRSLRDSFPELFGDRWHDARTLFYASYRDNHLAGLAPLPGAGELLEALRHRDIVAGVVSNKDGRYLRAEAGHLGWTHHFNALVGATDAPEDKPAPAPVHLALRGSGIAPGADVWLVGDAAIDMECAHRAGCRAILVGGGTDDVAAFLPHARYADCRALGDLVRGW